MTAPPPPEKVLILKPSSLGDVISGLPVLRGLKRTFPRASVCWLVTPGCAGVLSGQAELDEVILFDRKRFGRVARNAAVTREFVRFCRGLHRRRFDWVLDLQGLFRSAFLAFVTGASVRAGFAEARELASTFYTHRLACTARHTVDRNIQLARALGVDARGEDLKLTVTDEARASTESILRERGVRPGQYYLIAPGTRRANKLYPKQSWRRVVSELTEDLPVVVVGAPGERGLCAEVADGHARAIDLGGKSSLPELVALIALAGAVVCCDSAANFIAPAVGTPFVTLMGPTRPERTGPYGRRGKAVTADIPCLGCLKRACGHATCMQWISPVEVVATAREALSGAAEVALPANSPRA